MNDFAIANVHFASGQENDEAHLAALIILEQSFGALLRAKSIRESDQIIVGDMNDNPNNSDLLFGYLEHRNFRPLVTADSPATRLNNNLTSVIDNVYINNSADGEIPTDRATVFRPENSDPDGLAEFRRDFSDHVPVIFEVVIREDNDVD